MANEFAHQSTATAAGLAMAKTDWEDTDIHQFDSQATGDIMYASSATQLSRLGAGTTGNALIMGAIVPEWFTGLIFSNDGTKTTILGLAGDYTRFGDAQTTQHVLASEDDCMVTGKLEVTGISYFDNTMIISKSGVNEVLTVTSPTSACVVRILGGTNNYAAILELIADLGADNVDRFRISANNGGILRFEEFSTGAWLSPAYMTAVGFFLGTAGTLQGNLNISGVTSGKVIITTAAAAGSWTLTLPTAVGGAGEQLTDAAGDGITSWAAAASLRDYKDIAGLADPHTALDQLLNTKAYRFHYKEGRGTLDVDTEYVGVMADEAPWAMHYNGGIVNPVNTLGYMVLGFQAVDERIKELEAEIIALKEVCSGKGL